MCEYHDNDIKIAVVGMGYVGFSLAIMLAKFHKVFVVDTNQEKIEMINHNQSPFKDKYIDKYIKKTELNISASIDGENVYAGADFVIIAVPTNFKEEDNSFDTSTLENVIRDVKATDSKATIVIKSTVPIGFTQRIEKEYGGTILFSPEFLRETNALYDCLYPSRIIVSSPGGVCAKEMEDFAQLVTQSTLEKNTRTIFMDSSEAEAVKLFSNAYLAMRVAFFNELDTYACVNGLRAETIIDGVCEDDRIGHWYNNPSFGYGGYCLPKDSKQLHSSFGNVPQKLVSAIVESNQVRKKFISEMIVHRIKEIRKESIDRVITVGIYRLTMKHKSDNFRESSIYDVIAEVQKQDIRLVVYEPLLHSEESEYEIVDKISEFLVMTDIIVANRIDKNLENVLDKVISRDAYGRD